MASLISIANLNVRTNLFHHDRLARYVASNLSTPVFARRTESLRKSALLVKVVLLLFTSRLCFFRVSIFCLTLSRFLSRSLYAAKTTRLGSSRIINSSRAEIAISSQIIMRQEYYIGFSITELSFALFIEFQCVK